MQVHSDHRTVQAAFCAQQAPGMEAASVTESVGRNGSTTMSRPSTATSAKLDASLVCASPSKSKAENLLGQGYSKRQTVRTAKYIPRVATPISPPSRRAQLGQPDLAAETLRRTIQRSLSAPSLQSLISGTVSPPSPASPARPKSRAANSTALKVGGNSEVSSSTMKIGFAKSAGVLQADLNPNIPFSGFPSLSYLRG